VIAWFQFRRQADLDKPEQNSEHGSPEDRLPETTEQREQTDTGRRQKTDKKRVFVCG